MHLLCCGHRCLEESPPPSVSGFHEKDMCTLTKPTGLYFGRQIGIQEADADKLYIDGVYVVSTSIWMSMDGKSRQGKIPNLRDVWSASSDVPVSPLVHVQPI